MKKKFRRGTAFAACAAIAMSSAVPVYSVTAAENTAASGDYYLRGDCFNNDGVSGMDALKIQHHLLELHDFQGTDKQAADVNPDGNIDMSDVVSIMMWLSIPKKDIHAGEYVPVNGSVDRVGTMAATGGSQRFEYSAPEDGHYKFRFKYSGLSQTRELRLIVDNEPYYVPVEFTASDSEKEAIAIVGLTAGRHDIILENDGMEISIDPLSEIYRCINMLDEKVEREAYDTTTTTSDNTTTTTTTTTTSTTTETTTTTTTTTAQNKYYASNATVVSGVANETANAGYESPDGYANVDNMVGSSIEWTVEVAESGNYEIDFRYAHGKDDDRTMQVIINGSSDAYYISFPSTGDFTTWSDSTIVLPLTAGTNTIKAVSSTAAGGPNIDYIELTKTDKEPVQPAVTERYYAVEAQFLKGIEESTNQASEEKPYVNVENCIGSYIEWTVNAPAEGNYLVDFRFANGTDVNRQIKLITNGDRVRGQYVDFGSSGSWTTWTDTTAVVHLNAGKNTLKAYSTTSNGGPNMEYIELSQTGQAAPTAKATQGKRVENLNRGVSAAYTGSGVLVSWRQLATDNENTTFDLWRIRSDTDHTLLGTFTMDQASNYLDKDGLATDSYTIDTYVNGECTEFAQFSTNFPNKNSGQSGAYFDIPLKTPAGLTMPDGTACTYAANDCSVGDIDGDGQYEIFVKWDPSNSQDNSKDGYTGNVYIDCYRLDGTFVWRVDLGKNIRAGAHYTQFMVYDFDGDNKCEMICKTSDGTVDGQGNVIGDGSKDYRSTAGRILTGNEYITLFDGATGKALDTQNYKPGRGTVGDWGDTYGNRVDRFTACVAYLDGVNPYACFGRGYYTRSAITAYGVSGGKLVEKWAYDTGNNKSTAGYGDGNHHILGADVDQDGKDEVVVGSAVVDDNGQLLYTTSLAHGDAIHIGDFDPANAGLEIFQCLEDEVHPNGTAVNYGTILRAAGTGKVLFRETAGGDTGRCVADNLVTGNGGAEMVGSHNSVVYSATGSHEKVCDWSNITKWGQNSVVYWTDVLERAVLDRTMADQYGKGRVFTGDGVTYNNASKSNACITCDLLGDWREEMIFPKSDGTGLRVFTTTYSSNYNIYTLMQNTQYRVQVAAQNNGYNQPPHTDYYLDSTEYIRPEEPDVWNN